MKDVTRGDIDEGFIQVTDTLRVQMEMEPSEFVANPREWDNLGTMVCWHGRYNLGDEQPRMDAGDYKLGMVEDIDTETRERAESLIYQGKEDEARQIIEEVLDDEYIILPLYLYDHSGITMNTTGFSCPWDSGQVGFIYVRDDKVKKEYGWDKLTQERVQQVKDQLRAEVEAYDLYLRGESYWYRIEELKDGEWEEIDSCGGYLGTEYFLQEVNETLKRLTA